MLGIFFVLLFFCNATLSIKICSFNVRTFGEAKRAIPEVVDVIVKVISRCDIMLVMEIKDTQNKTCPFLMEKLNSLSNGTEKEFKYVISERLGRKTYKEQYAFIYRPKLVSVKQTYQYPDRQPGDEDAFSREPFVVRFQSPRSAVSDFVIIPQHTTPETAVREIDELYDVYLDVKQQWKSKNFIFMGDFNAGCGYVAKKHWKDIRLKTQSEFVWLIGDTNDTTVKGSTRWIIQNAGNAFQILCVMASKVMQSSVGVGDKNPFNHNYKETCRFRWKSSRFCKGHEPRSSYRNGKSEPLYVKFEFVFPLPSDL
uniref:Deoxyribonuclease 1L3 n=1 Tax=Crocodylus porosus TaxID=8502 RepID=A0A7M4FMI7_CROPO